MLRNKLRHRLLRTFGDAEKLSFAWTKFRGAGKTASKYWSATARANAASVLTINGGFCFERTDETDQQHEADQDGP